jgi:hypothetical protein
MDPITGLLFITVTGIILLLGLFGVCVRYAYIAVRSHTAQEETGDQLVSEPDEHTDRSGREMRDTGDFVFGDANE